MVAARDGPALSRTLIPCLLVLVGFRLVFWTLLTYWTLSIPRGLSMLWLEILACPMVNLESLRSNNVSKSTKPGGMIDLLINKGRDSRKSGSHGNSYWREFPWEAYCCCGEVQPPSSHQQEHWLPERTESLVEFATYSSTRMEKKAGSRPHPNSASLIC